MSEDGEERTRLVDRLVVLTGAKGSAGTRERLLALPVDKLRRMVGSVERAIAEAEAQRTPADDGGARRALLRSRVDAALGRLDAVSRRSRRLSDAGIPSAQRRLDTDTQLS